MAISNITNFIAKSVFPAFLAPSGFRRRHENISCSINPNSYFELHVSAQNAAALQMLNRCYRFRFRDEQYSLINPLGVRSVVSVVIHSDCAPEVGLFCDSLEVPEFYSLSDLLVVNEVLRIN